MTQRVETLQTYQRIDRLAIRGLGPSGGERLLISAARDQDDEMQTIGIINRALKMALDL